MYFAHRACISGIHRTTLIIQNRLKFKLIYFFLYIKQILNIKTNERKRKVLLHVSSPSIVAKQPYNICKERKKKKHQRDICLIITRGVKAQLMSDEMFFQSVFIRRAVLRIWCLFVFISILLLIRLSYKSLAFTDCQNFCPYSSRLTKKYLEFNSSFRIHHYPEFICPQNFRNLADWIYRWPSQFKEQVETRTDNGGLIAPCLPHGSIIYVRIWAIDEFFKKIYPQLINSFVLITGEGDLSSPVHLQHLEGSDSKIIHWFGQNGQFDVSKTTKFTHIPIGKYLI